MTRERTHSGLTIIEVLVVLAILGILLAIAIPNLRPPAAQLAADAAQAFIQQARFDAIRLNERVGITVGDREFATRQGGCSGTVMNRLDLVEFPQVSASGSSFMWSATGQPRTCADTPLSLSGVRFQFADSRRETAVTVGSGGVVTTE